jgi:SAM-dependent methyltransferase
MPSAGTPPAAARATTADTSRERRWEEMLGSLAALLPPRSRRVLVDGPAAQLDLFTARFAAQPGPRKWPALVTAGPVAAGDVTIFLRTAPRHSARRDADLTEQDTRADDDRRAREERADIVIDLHDAEWPVIRRVAAPLAARGPWYLTETRAFFACRAATWDTKFGDDLPAYRAAVAESGLAAGAVVIDVGCGTGRALPPLRDAVGRSGAVIALDVTPEMLHAARAAATVAGAALVLADARALPFADRSADAIFAAGLVNHLPDSTAGLRELARVTRPGGLLVLFHPSGRVALAARHGHSVARDEPLAEEPLRRNTAASGWQLTGYDDAPHRFLAVAVRVADPA